MLLPFLNVGQAILTQKPKKTKKTKKIEKVKKSGGVRGGKFELFFSESTREILSVFHKGPLTKVAWKTLKKWL